MRKKFIRQWDLKATDERAEEAAREEIPIPAMSSDMQREMAEATIPVDDRDAT